MGAVRSRRRTSVLAYGPGRRRADTPDVTLLEARFPVAMVSRLVAADRRNRDAAYQAHRWWARRPPSLIRAALLAASCPASTTDAEFARLYADPAQHLAGLTVLDPFLGGGTTLLEAARLGARAVGTDVDPFAVMLSEHQLDPPSPDEVLAAGRALLTALREQLGDLWPTSPADDPAAGQMNVQQLGLPLGEDASDQWHPLHYFSVAQVTCPACSQPGPLYRSLILARSVGREGAVRRSCEVSAFCPDCFSVHELAASATSLTCCGVTRSLSEVTYERAKYVCACGKRSTHEQLQTGVAPRIPVAVEETRPGTRGQRRIRAVTGNERAMNAVAAERLAASGLPVPSDLPLQAAADDARPLSFGIRTVGDLHTSRQLLFLAAARALIDGVSGDERVRRALALAVSGTITSNNRLCGYATDYGRLAPLFSVRAFSLPWLTVELNPLNPDGGRGTLLASITKVARSCELQVRRTIPVPSGDKTTAMLMTLPRTSVDSGSAHQVTCVDATGSSPASRNASGLGGADPAIFGQADLCLTDPPYFDFIAYDALSQVFRAWQPHASLAGAPLLPTLDDPVTSFGTRLGAALAAANAACRPGALLAFTYKGNADAWDAIGLAFDEAKLRVTGLWPVLADPHMGHHAHAGNCEFDLLVIARAVTATAPAEVPSSTTVADWVRALSAVKKVSQADQDNMARALSMASSRWGSVLSD